jgi:Ig domain of plant-specific actin-binding protein
VRARALIAAALAAAGVAGAAVGVAGAAFTSTTATSASTFTAAAEFPPVVAQVPAALGVAQAGAAMRATAGAFSPAPSSIAYAWLRCDGAGANCVSNGGTTADYTPGLGDIGKTLRVDATPRNGSTPGATVRSEPTQVVLALNLGPGLQQPVAAFTPSIAGTATVGGTLSAANGGWAVTLASIAYKWQRCDAIGTGCAVIAGATSQTYAPTAADRGRRLSLMVTASALGLLPTTVTTVTTAVVG